MRVSHRWLTELLPRLDLPIEQIAERLTLLGVLVEEVVRTDRGLESIVLGRVVTVGPHPAAERLKLCMVETGPGGVRQIVCGAPVVREAAFYPVALPGSRLPNGVAVGVSEIRGERSEGMLCSAPELGLEHLGSAQGILELDPEGRAPGSPIAPLLGLDDVVLVLEVPSNRPDWESHLGVARELQELAGERVCLPAAGGGGPLERTARSAADGTTANGVSVRLLDEAGCPRYTGLVVRGVRVGPSPLRVQQRLFACGARPINNVVDATNYVLLELGTPLHAFDLERVGGGEILVRRAVPGERLLTLDGKERALDAEMTVIADRDGAIAIGGVMGGAGSEVSAATRDLFLEAAFFDPERIRRTAARLGLRTEASHRFGRGVDPTAVTAGLRRAGELVGIWAGGSPAGRTIDLGRREGPPVVLELRSDRVRAVAGIFVTAERARQALAAVDLPAEAADGALRVTVPGHRFDLAREIDLVEEVVRRIGYERVPAEPLPLRAGTTSPGEADVIAELRERLRGLGLDEAYTTSFLDPAPFGRGFYEGRLLEQANPLAQNERFLRPAVAATLVLAARYNLRRGRRGAAFYEIGHVFRRRDRRTAENAEAGARAAEQPEEHHTSGHERGQGRAGNEQAQVGTAGWAASQGPPCGTRGGRPSARDGLHDETTWGELPQVPGVDERRRLGIVLAGSLRPLHWSDGGREREADFYSLKGLVEAVITGPGGLRAAPAGRGWLHPGQQADLALDGRPLGFLGRLHPRVERALDFETRAFVAELDLAPLLRPSPPALFGAISSFPRVERDLALVVPEERAAAEVEDLVRSAALAHLVEVRLFDVYRGDPVPAGTRSLAFRLVFQSAERTLTEEDVEREVRRLLEILAGAGLRIR